MSLAKKNNKIYSYKDYCEWNDDGSWEIIDGNVYDMSPAPSSKHQQIVSALNYYFYDYLKDKTCQVFPAPYDIIFSDKLESDENIFTVVQPDLSIICDSTKIDERGCVGAPDICIEVLSDSTAYKDETVKLKLYEKYGVKEYWIVNPEVNYIMIYNYNGTNYDKPEYYHKDDIIKSRILVDMTIDLKGIFQEK